MPHPDNSARQRVHMGVFCISAYPLSHRRAASALVLFVMAEDPTPASILSTFWGGYLVVKRRGGNISVTSW